MAYSSSRGGSSRSNGGRGGGSTAKATNATAYAVAGILVALVVVLFLVLGGKKKTPPPAPPPPPPPTQPATSTPVKPGEKAYPTITQAVQAEGQALVRTFEKDAADASRLYVESQKAKKAGDDAAWQAKFKQARQLADSINTRWNEFIDRLPTGNGYDTSDMERHYFPREAGRVQTMVKDVLAASKSDEK
jgi:hypothetical protein